MEYYRLDLYVPETHAETVANALFQAGAGKAGNYEHCCFSVRGAGRFRPLSGANPFLGECGKDEFVPEVKLEMIVPEERKQAVLAALKKVHPYETPAFQCWRVDLDLP